MLDMQQNISTHLEQESIKRNTTAAIIAMTIKTKATVIMGTESANNKNDNEKTSNNKVMHQIKIQTIQTQTINQNDFNFDK